MLHFDEVKTSTNDGRVNVSGCFSRLKRFASSNEPSQSFDREYSRACERRHVDVLLPAAQPTPSGGGGTHEAAKTQRQQGQPTWDQSHRPAPADGWIHAVLQPGTSGPEPALRAGSTAA